MTVLSYLPDSDDALCKAESSSLLMSLINVMISMPLSNLGSILFCILTAFIY